jgi:hypothetical protein
MNTQTRSRSEDCLMRTSVLVCAGVLAALPLGLGAAGAAPVDITVGPDVVARVRVAAGGYTVEQRAQIAQDRVLTILSDASLTADTIADAVTVRKSGADRAVYVGKNLFFTITTADASATQATVEELAKMWAGNLRTALPKVKPLQGPPPEGAA